VCWRLAETADKWGKPVVIAIYMTKQSGQSDPSRQFRKQKLSEQGTETDLEASTPAERIGMMWQLAIDAWAFKGEGVAESRLPRHVVRVLRGQS
jgi:hypothetical protein